MGRCFVRVVGDGDFRTGISVENSTQTNRHSLDKVRLSDNLIIGLVVCQLPAVNFSEKNSCPKRSNDPSFATSLPIA